MEMEQKNLKPEKEKTVSVAGIILLCMAAVNAFLLAIYDISQAIGGIFFALILMLFLVVALADMIALIAVPVLLLIIMIQAIRFRKQKRYLKNCMLSVTGSFALIGAGVILSKYFAPQIADFVTSRKMKQYEFAADKIHSGTWKKGNAYSVGGMPEHEDVAFLQSETWTSMTFIIYSEDEICDADSIIQYEWENDLMVPVKENWYQITIDKNRSGG